METGKTQPRVAEPAEEEIKKHGDQLQQPVAGAAGKDAQDENEKRDPNVSGVKGNAKGGKGQGH